MPLDGSRLPDPPPLPPLDVVESHAVDQPAGSHPDALDGADGVDGTPRSDGGLDGWALDPDSIGPAELDAIQRQLEGGGSGLAALDGADDVGEERLQQLKKDGQPPTAAAGSQPELRFEFGCWGHRFAGDSVLWPPLVGAPR